MIYPTIQLFRVSLSQTEFFDPVAFVGLENFRYVLSDPDFWAEARITAEFVAGSLSLALVFGVLTAVILQSLGGKAAAIFRTILLLPWTLSMTVVGCLWLWLLNPSYGPVRYLLSLAGYDTGLLLGDPDLAIWLIVGASAWWSFPYAMVLVTAALQSIPKELYEAVEIDGGSALAKFRFVTWPHIIPTLGSTALVLCIMYVTLVSLIVVMTGGGPLGETTTFSLAIYKETLNSIDIAPAAVISIIVLIANLVLGIGYSVLSARIKRSK
ncbi:sugar ABC transporter permease [Tabrizicola sp. KVB23]|uniref:Sugar ABC transporter permease n=2 Tax=Fuscibacter oryzae TaxID=2803939 RepID=A0A8J7MTN4_9RHOB|nr:sugar ABC transporter permease [Fuscibacter oryzae]